MIDKKFGSNFFILKYLAKYKNTTLRKKISFKIPGYKVICIFYA